MKTYELKNDFQTIRFLDTGATIYEWIINDQNFNIVLTNDDTADYLDSKKGFFGSTIGRVTNRIRDGIFSLNDQTYQLNKNFNQNAGHGGPTGFWSRIFDVISHTDESITFQYISKDGEENYPGELTLRVTYELKENELLLSYEATTTADTIVNITNHSYFNLSSIHNILDHELTIDAPYFLEYDAQMAPTGKQLSVMNTALDFTKPTRIGHIIEDPFLQQPITLGIDHHFVFNQPKLTLKGELYTLDIATSYPGVQIYTTNLPSFQKEKYRGPVHKYMGIAIEPQYEIDAINHSNFSNIILKKNEKYQEFISYRITSNNLK